MPGDINGDCRVDEADEAILAARVPAPGTTAENVPPSVTLLAPTDGETFAYPTPVIFQPAVADPNGYLVSVDYAVEYRTAGSTTIYSAHGDPHDDWRHTWEWWRTTGVPFEGSCTVRVKAVDNYGHATVLPEIQISLVATD
jgi:hypothetical protein